MPIGDVYAHVSSNRLSRWGLRCLGAFDLHTHIRLKPMLDFFANHIRAGSRCRVLEVGCGDGVNAFEFAKLAQQRRVTLRYCGIDITAARLERARQLARQLHLETCTEFLQIDAARIDALPAEPVDLLVLADVIEHIEDPEGLLRSLRPKLAEQAICLVSVPTPLYERVFGAAFHRKVGHVRSGYDLKELNALFATIGGRLTAHRYSTGLPSNLGCALYYRMPANRWAIMLKTLGLLPFRYLDLYNSPSVSCSLFAAYSFER